MWALAGQGLIHRWGGGGLDTDGLTIDLNQFLPCKILYPVLVLTEENLSMLVINGWVIENELTSRPFPMVTVALCRNGGWDQIE